MAQAFEIYNGDTINFTDINNKKQGLWIKLDNNGDKILEQGNYLKGKKEGLWISYHTNGKTKHEITYNKGKASGPARFYYDNGIICEEGIWNIDHWQGKYRYYNKNGSLAYDWNYNNTGKRTGEQKYYHKNGTLKYTGNWKEGKASGTLKIFDESGVLITERVYEDGKFEDNIVVTSGEKTKEKAPSQIANNSTPQELQKFRGTGMHTVFNLSGQIEKKGFFVNGKLFNGQHYFYNNKELIKVIYYQNGTLKKTEDVSTQVNNEAT